jgi:hypothetical protein
MRTRFTSTITAAVGFAALTVAALTPTASAREGGTFEESITSDSVVCRTTTTDGLHRVQALVVKDDRGRNSYLMQVFENFGNIELVMESSGEPAWGDGTVRATGPLSDPIGNPMPGESSFAVAYTMAADSITRTERLQEGNQRIVARTTTTPFELSDVALRVTGLTLQPLDCVGRTVNEVRTFTTPAKFVDSMRSFEINPDVGCFLTGDAEVSAEVIGRELSIFVRNLPGDTPDVEGSLHLQGDEGTGMLTLRNADGAAVGRAPVAATLTQLAPAVVDQFSDDGFFLARRLTPYRLDLTIELSGGAQSTSCRMDLITQRIRVDLPK